MVRIPSYLGSARKSKGKVVESKRSNTQWAMIKCAYRDARRCAERQGLMLKGTEKIWDSSIANIGILWATETASERLGDYLKVVYPPFWRRELDIENVAVVETCLKKADIDPSGFNKFQQGEGRTLHDALQRQLHHGGTCGVPSFVFDGEILFGREHLPCVRWHLTGRKESQPDIAHGIGENGLSPGEQ